MNKAELSQKYGDSCGRADLLKLYFTDILDNSGLEWFMGKKLLDVGCGSKNAIYQDAARGGVYYEFRGNLPAFFGECGGIAVGIDIGQQVEELKQYYTHIVANLVPLLDSGEGLVNLVKEYGPFDIINCSLLWWREPSHVFAASLDYGDEYYCSFGYPDGFWDIVHQMEGSLIRQSERLLMTGGLLAIDHVFRRWGGSDWSVLE